MQGCPDSSTIKTFFNEDDRDRDADSLAFARHNKATGWEGRLAKYIADNVRRGSSLDDYAYATQFVQAEAVANAFSAWRSKFKGGVAGAQCAGALVWQFNDVVRNPPSKAECLAQLTGFCVSSGPARAGPSLITLSVPSRR